MYPGKIINPVLPMKILKNVFEIKDGYSRKKGQWYDPASVCLNQKTCPGGPFYQSMVNIEKSDPLCHCYHSENEII
jgi:hypothetical protein